MAEVGMSLIETRDLCQRREGKDILKNINVTVERGEILAFIGPTGAGKTTLLRLMDLLDKPASGRIFFRDVDVTDSEKVRLETRRRMSFVLQKPIVFNMNVQDNVAYSLRWRRMDKRQTRKKVGEILETVGMSDYAGRNARTLSGGEMQRVAIARAIITEPEVLLLDEPTANLDPVSASKIEDLIADIIKKENITVVMNTHDMVQGQRLANRISVIVNGEIVQTGDPRSIFSSPLTRQVAELVGMENILDGTVVINDGEISTIDVNGRLIEAISNFDVGTAVSVCMRPEDVTLARSETSTSARNSLAGEVTRVSSTGPLCRIEIDCGFRVVALVTRRSTADLGLEKGAKVYANFKVVSIHVIRRN
jgi:tungstate transport system ATP-binding protein